MEFADYIEILKALGESTRLHIFERLCHNKWLIFDEK